MQYMYAVLLDNNNLHFYTAQMRAAAASEEEGFEKIISIK